MYYHMAAPSTYQVGDQVWQHRPIGLVGSTGISTGPHLHWEVRKDGVQVNPRDYLDLGEGAPDV